LRQVSELEAGVLEGEIHTLIRIYVNITITIVLDGLLGNYIKNNHTHNMQYIPLAGELLETPKMLSPKIFPSPFLGTTNGLSI
jgi:hypothetical protein